jgi:hypothetical protein
MTDGFGVVDLLSLQILETTPVHCTHLQLHVSDEVHTTNLHGRLLIAPTPQLQNCRRQSGAVNLILRHLLRHP